MKYFILVVFLFMFQINFSGRIKYNLIKNEGSINIFFINKQVLNVTFYIKKGYILLILKNGKERFIPFESHKQEGFFDTDLEILLLKRIHLKRATFYLNIGLKDYPFETSMVTGLINIIIINFFCLYNQEKKHSIITSKVYSAFNTTELKIGIKTKFSLSLADMLLSIFEFIFVNKILKIKTLIQYK